MSAPNEIPAPESQAEVLGTQEGMPDPQVSPPGETGSLDGSPASGTDESSNEGNWEKRAKDWQAKHTKLSQQSKPIKQLLEQHGGDRIAGFIGLLERAVSDPSLGPIIQQFDQTGKVELPQVNANSQQDEEDYERPWLGDLKTFKDEILQAVQTASQGLEQLQTRSGQDAVARATKNYLGKYPELNSDELGHVQEQFDHQIQTLGRTPQGRQALLNMDDESMERIMAPIMSPHMDDIYERRHANKQRGREGMATDAPGVLGTTGREPRVEGGEQPRTYGQITEAARRGAREIFKEQGWNPDRPFS